MKARSRPFENRGYASGGNGCFALAMGSWLSHGLKVANGGSAEGVPRKEPSAESRQSGAESVTAAPLAFEPCVERYLRERRGSIKVDSCSPGAADPAPAAHQRRFGEQRGLDR
jgi:hypothetical protein